MLFAKNNSHIADLHIVFFLLDHRILLKIHRNVFLPLPEYTVEPILNSVFHEKDLQANNNDNFLFGKTSLYDNSKQMHFYYYAICVYLSTRYYTLQYLQCYSGASFSIGHGVVMVC